MTRLLVIEDDSRLRDLAVRLLKGAGYEVLAGEGGAHGLALWTAHGADLILTDLRLGDVTGFDVVRAVRAVAPDLPVIIMSGDTGGSAAELAALAGPVSVLKKPFFKAQLLDAITKALGAPRA